MNDIFNFAQQQMDNYSARFGAVDPMQQDVAWGCKSHCHTSCYGSCMGGCQTNCRGSCQNSCYYACQSFGMGTRNRGW